MIDRPKIIAWLLPWSGNDTGMDEDFRPAALLLHTGTGVATHFDLLLSTVPRPSPEDRCALGWRSTVAVHALLPEAAAALAPLAPHRALYLELGEARTLDGDRGRVEPVARGRWRSAGRGIVELAWTAHGVPWTMRFLLDGRTVDPDDHASLARATRVERLS